MNIMRRLGYHYGVGCQAAGVNLEILGRLVSAPDRRLVTLGCIYAASNPLPRMKKGWPIRLQQMDQPEFGL